MANIEITFGVNQIPGSTGFRPVVFQDKTFVFTGLRATKTARGAMVRAQKDADDRAKELRSMGNTVTVKVWLNSLVQTLPTKRSRVARRTVRRSRV